MVKTIPIYNSQILDYAVDIYRYNWYQLFIDFVNSFTNLSDVISARVSSDQRIVILILVFENRQIEV